MSGDENRGVDETATAAPLADTLTSTSSSAPPSVGSTPARVGRFEISSTLGAGGMGVVMLATDPLLGRKVAIKIVRSDRAGASDDAKRRLLREAQAMARLSHENTIVVHEVGEHGDEVYVAMEYVVGTTLTQWQTAKRSWREIVEMYLRAGRGLRAAHDAGLVHRDFKPDNVLVGEDGRVRVTDFGLVAARDAPAPRQSASAMSELDSQLTQTGALMGTPRYMAPEQHLGEDVDARADQFAFCVALYEALFRKAPFEGASYDELAKAVLAGTPQPMPDQTDVPLSIRAALLRGLSRDRDARFATMGALLAELSPVAAGTSRSRRWRLAAAAVGIAAVASAVIVVRLVRSDSHSAASHSADSPRPPEPASSREPREVAERMARMQVGFDEGTAAFSSHDYDAAARAFAQGYTLENQPVFLYNQAVALYMKYKATADAAALTKASALLQRYLAEEPQAYDREQVEALIAALRTGSGALSPEVHLHGFVRIQSVPPGGTLYIDAQKKPLGVTPWTGWLPGKHHLRVEKPGFGVLETDANIDGDKLTSWMFSLSPEPAP